MSNDYVITDLWRLEQVRDLLKNYLDAYPEHDQGDIQVYLAFVLLSDTLKGGYKLCDISKSTV